MPPLPRLGRDYADKSKEFIKACQDLQWTYDTKTLHRSDTNGIAERAVRRVKEVTATAMVQSGPPPSSPQNDGLHDGKVLEQTS